MTNKKSNQFILEYHISEFSEINTYPIIQLDTNKIKFIISLHYLKDTLFTSFFILNPGKNPPF